jgi:hypothetical protein
MTGCRLSSPSRDAFLGMGGGSEIRGFQLFISILGVEVSAGGGKFRDMHDDGKNAHHHHDVVLSLSIFFV